MYDLFMDALIDTAKMVPLLLIIYTAIEIIEYKFGNNINEKIGNTGKAGPVIGALLGCVPQCGFSVIATALYTKRILTLGTLLAVYLSTSDEAIPVILSYPGKAHIILPLLMIKVVIAIIAGYIIDAIIKRKGEYVNEVSVSSEMSGFSDVDEKGCCGHDCSKHDDKKDLILHPLIHTLKVFIFIFVVSLILNFIIYKLGEENLGKVLFNNSIFQPILTGLIGLIPNCASSIAITEVFLKGGLSFGSAIAGLSSSAGLGIIVLFKENKNKWESIKIIALLYTTSVIAGIIIQTIWG